MHTERHRLVLVHDYLTQRGGAERVVDVMARAFPDAPLLTSLYEPGSTFEGFAACEVRVGILNRVGTLRRHHRAALPLLAPWFAAQRIRADVVLASSSGWAHEVRTDGRLVVYCHAPARWLYQPDRYLRSTGSVPMAGAVARGVLGVLGPPLRRLDARAARRADTYLANSTATAALVADLYERAAEVLYPPPGLLPGGEEVAVDGLEGGFVLCVSRLLAYKHVDVLCEVARARPALRVVVVGDGPERQRLESLAPPNVRFLGTVRDAVLRWCYRNASVLVAIGYEDFGLAPVEAAAFGTPTVARRFGGFLDTVADGATGLLLDDLSVGAVAEAVDALVAHRPSAALLSAHAATFAEARFVARLREVVGLS